MIEAIASGLVLAAASGLAFWSYKDHDGYLSISMPLRLILSMLLIGVSGFIVGFDIGQHSKKEITYNTFLWVGGEGIAFLVFITILDYLPKLIKENNDKNNK